MSTKGSLHSAAQTHLPYILQRVGQDSHQHGHKEGFLGATKQKVILYLAYSASLWMNANFRGAGMYQTAVTKGQTLNAASVFRQLHEHQLPLVAICHHQTETRQCRAAGYDLKRLNHRAAETRQVSASAETPVITFWKLPVCSKEAKTTQHVASTCTATQALAHDSYQGIKYITGRKRKRFSAISIIFPIWQ